MEQKQVSDSTLVSILVPYFIGFCIFVFCLFLGYRTWINLDFSSGKSFVKLEQEVIEVDSLNPEFILNEGQTLSSILSDASVSSAQIPEIIDAFSKKYNPKKLSVGTPIHLHFNRDANGDLVFASMVVSVSNLKKIEVSINAGNQFSVKELFIPLIKRVFYQSSEVKHSFIGTALNMSIPSSAIMSMVKAFSYDVDFQRDIKFGDKLEVVIEKFYTEDGKLSHTGNILYSSLVLGDKKLVIYHFVHPDGQVAFYNERGESIKKEFLRTPINAAKISSKFGKRNHPVLGFTRMHKGVDFAAPIGTPILAAGGGVVEKAGNVGGYGKYVRIKHNAIYSTVYGHASRFAKGIKQGVKVSQGQVIAYVGMTGITSGPHLHYEVLEHGKQINPLKFKFSSSSDRLTGKLLDLFKQNKSGVDKILSTKV